MIFLDDVQVGLSVCFWSSGLSFYLTSRLFTAFDPSHFRKLQVVKVSGSPYVY